MNTSKLTVSLMFMATMAWANVAQAEEPCGAPARSFATSSCQIVEAPSCGELCSPSSVVLACVASNAQQCSNECNSLGGSDCGATCSTQCDNTCAGTTLPYIGDGRDCEYSCSASCMGDCSAGCLNKGDKTLCFASCSQSCQAHCTVSCDNYYYDDDDHYYYDDDDHHYYDDDDHYYDDDDHYYDDDDFGRVDCSHPVFKKHPRCDRGRGKKPGRAGASKGGGKKPGRAGGSKGGQQHGPKRGGGNFKGNAPGGYHGRYSPVGAVQALGQLPTPVADIGFTAVGDIDSPCNAGCEASCVGACEADVARDCELDCQSERVGGCQADMANSCTTACNAGAVIVCDGQYVDAPDIGACVADLEREGVEITGHVPARVPVETGAVEAAKLYGAGSCSVEEPGNLRFGGALFSLLGLGMGAGFFRRRRQG
jgi:hypothetical protein